MRVHSNGVIFSVSCVETAIHVYVSCLAAGATRAHEADASECRSGRGSEMACSERLAARCQFAAPVTPGSAVCDNAWPWSSSLADHKMLDASPTGFWMLSS